MGEYGLAFFGEAIGAALTVVGASYGIGKLASSALEGIARQPEAAGQLRAVMIIAAALIEGIAFLALIFCMFAGSNVFEINKMKLDAKMKAAAGQENSSGQKTSH